jgi:hypothetical protein
MTVQGNRILSSPVLAMGVALVTASHVMACDPAVYTGGSALLDKRISIGPDCSFQDEFVERNRGSVYFTLNSRSGGPVVDVGNGLIAQKVIASEICGPSETLLFVDCTTGQSVLIYGKPEPNDEGGWNGSFIKFIQKPYGPISITPQSEVDELINTAKTNDLGVVEDAKTFLEGKRKRDRYDFACGCKLYYPDSVAATD